jgi:O-methyltransferase
MNALSRIWDEFQEKRLIQTVLPYTLVSPERIHNLYVLAKRIEDEEIPGDVVECGVYKGGTAAKNGVAL